jgi:hypothetical protein
VENNMMNYQEYERIASLLEAFVDNSVGKWDWDDYTSGVPSDDLYLRNIQLRMIRISDEFPPDGTGGYCSPEGSEVIRSCILELRARAAARR